MKPAATEKAKTSIHSLVRSMLWPGWMALWSVNDNGDVPPRWKIGGPKSLMKKPRGVPLNPKHKELIVADMRWNSVLTYYCLEMF